MKLTNLACVGTLLALSFIFDGCLFEPFNSLDVETNCSSKTWHITAEFESGKILKYEQRPGESTRYQRTSINEAMPILKTFAAVSEDLKPINYSLSAEDVSKLRNASEGRLILVLYDRGVFSLDPNVFPKSLGQSQEEYIQFLQDHEKEASKWTEQILKHDQGLPPQPLN